MTIAGLIDGSVSVDLLSCYLEFKYALSVFFTSVMFPLPHLSNVYRLSDGLSAKIIRAPKAFEQSLGSVACCNATVEVHSSEG